MPESEIAREIRAAIESQNQGHELRKNINNLLSLLVLAACVFIGSTVWNNSLDNKVILSTLKIQSELIKDRLTVASGAYLSERIIANSSDIDSIQKELSVLGTRQTVNEMNYQKIDSEHHDIKETMGKKVDK
jgi:hypothetical protein